MKPNPGESSLNGQVLGSPSETVKNNEKLGMDPTNKPKWPPMSQLYRFGQFVLDPRKRTLSRADSPIVLTPKAFDVLMFLVQNPHRLVTKEELLQAIWGDTSWKRGTTTRDVPHS